MRFGVLSAILDGWSFEDVIDIAAEIGYECVELACWPAGGATRRYAGVSHINVDELDEAAVKHIKDYSAAKNITISSLGYYPNPLDANEDAAKASREHLMKLIGASAALGINTVTTFIGRNQYKTLEENLDTLADVWRPILDYALEKGVKIAIENCPMLFTVDQWPGGQNLMTTPDVWRRVFEILPHENLGINYDPSHFIWQGVDYIAPLYEFKDRIFHVHFKDIKLFPEKLAQVGVMAYPLDYMSPKLPGLGDVDWGRYVSALNDIGYDGPAVVEIEDKAFEDSRERVLDSLKLSYRYLRQFVI